MGNRKGIRYPSTTYEQSILIQAHQGEAEFLERYHLEGIEMTREIAKVYKAKMKVEK